MKLAFVYAGQGSQKPQMGLDLYNQNSVFKNALDMADATGEIKQLMFNADAETLADTRNTQPCMVAFAAAVTEMLKQSGIVPQMALGLSLGEYSALCLSGVWDAQTAVQLAKFRGNAMANAVTGIKSGMAAILGLEREKLQKACDNASEIGVVQIANYNCSSQLVIAGEKQAVEKACEYATELGAKRCVPLQVSGPFHTTLMKPAGDALNEKFKQIKFEQMQIPIVFNATAKTIQPDQTVQALLEKQVQSSVYFEDSILYLQECGVDTIVEIGPGKVLSGFIKKIAPQITCYNVEDVKTAEQAITALTEN